MTVQPPALSVPGSGGAPIPPPGATRAPAIQPATDLTGVLVLKHEDRFLLTDAFGDIHPDTRGLGLYRGDTRILSRYELRVNGHRPVVLRTAIGGSYRGTIQMTNPDVLRRPDGGRDPELALRRQSFGILRDRLIAAGVRELIAVDNFTTHPEPCRLSLSLEADFADIFEVRGLERAESGTCFAPRIEPRRVTFDYLGRDGTLRRTHVDLSEPVRLREGPGVTLELDWLLEPGGQGRLEVLVRDEAVDDVGPPARAARAPRAPRSSGTARAVSSRLPDVDPLAPVAAHEAWDASSATITTGDGGTTRAIRRALSDLRLLVNPGPAPGEAYIAAGVPWYSCLFGRDSIITALELLPVRPQVARDTLELLARLQATERDDRRDAQPGKILHELRTGELARVGEIPHTPYYGTADATPLWLILLGETYAWTGDRELVDRLWPNALAALAWIEGDGDPDGDGFVEYERRSELGLVNQGWKDSLEANRHRDGRLARPPLALVEVQAYVYAARRHVAALARMRGEAGLAAAQEAAAERLRERFEAAFWMEDEGTYAMALDGARGQVDAVSSNPGHALWCGIADPARAARVAASLRSPGLWSGWGVRTLSSAMAGYNPIGYHIGSVWPHDNAIIAAGLARYGFGEQAVSIAAAMLEATRHFRDARLPELFCGFARSDAPYPVPYPVACQPEAWAAGSVFSFLRSMLGMEADAAAGELVFRSPSVPDWLREVRIERLRVGAAEVDLLVRRSNGSTAVEVLRRSGELTVVVRV